ncbi:MAG TPA: LuxR C-terminal-related transcriptional regulator [Rubrivivax sp.]|jgi:DNA-binding CsgD family transcriptional regulator|nr:LuxR C-terminal-related transcriptional regulator [Rubrivivax sp.]
MLDVQPATPMALPASFRVDVAERRWTTHRSGVTASLLAAMLDEVGHGVMLISSGLHLLHANHVARQDLDDEAHPLTIRGQSVGARSVIDGQELQRAVVSAGRGLRSVLMLGLGADKVSLAVVPLATDEVDPPVLLCLGSRSVGEPLSLSCFARHHGLSPAERRVLEALCEGLEPRAIAVQFGVGLATVRTQIRSIRRKTEAADITTLVRMVARLPPLVSTLRTTRAM